MFKVPFVNYVVLIIICAILSRQIKNKITEKKVDIYKKLLKITIYSVIFSF